MAPGWQPRVATAQQSQDICTAPPFFGVFGGHLATQQWTMCALWGSKTGWRCIEFFSGEDGAVGVSARISATQW